MFSRLGGRPLLPDAGRPVPGGDSADVRTRRCADVSGPVPGRRWEDAFDQFEEQRKINVEYLRDLPSEAGGRVALHREAGQITLNQMLHEWALHDLDHIRQLPNWCGREIPGRCRSIGRLLPTEAVSCLFTLRLMTSESWPGHRSPA